MRKINLLVVLLLCFAVSTGGQASIFKKMSRSLNVRGEKDLKKAEAFFDQNQYAQAIPFYLKFFKKNKEHDDVKVLYHVAVCYMEVKQPQEGYAYVQEAASKSPNDLDIGVLKGEYEVALGDSKKAIETYTAVLKSHPDDYLSYIRVGELYVDQGDIKHAREMWKKAIDIDANRPEAYSRMSQSYLRIEKNRLEAYYYGRRLLEVVDETDKPGVQRMLDNLVGDMGTEYENYFKTRDCMSQAEDFFKQAKFKEAYALMSECKGIPNLPGKFFLLYGKVCDEVGKFDDAAYAYERCMALGLESGDLCYRLGWSYLNSGRPEKAEIAFKRAAKYDETREKALNMLQKMSKSR